MSLDEKKMLEQQKIFLQENINRLEKKLDSLTVDMENRQGFVLQSDPLWRDLTGQFTVLNIEYKGLKEQLDLMNGKPKNQKPEIPIQT